jgi:phospholipase/carboxylesterase
MPQDYDASEAIPFDHSIDRDCASGGSPPLLVLLHGSGDDRHGLLGVGAFLAPACGGAIVVSLQGPLSRGPGFCWFQGSSASPAPDAETSIAAEAAKVLHILQNVPSRLGTDPTRTYLFGHSQGAAVCWAVALSNWPRADLVRGVACNSGRLFPGLLEPNSVLGQQVAPAAALGGRHVLCAHGSGDVITPVQYGRQNGPFCEQLGLPHTYFEHREGHNDLRQPLAHVSKHFEALASPQAQQQRAHT